VTIAEVLRDASARLQDIGDTGTLDATWLLEHASGLDRAQLLTRGDEPLGEDIRERFSALVLRRAAGEPIAYLIGTVGFYGRTFGVDERVLVPRPETEHLVEAVIADIRGRKKTGGVVVDVGTGSGAIAITLACELPELSVFGTDISADALAVARHNAARNLVFQHCTFLQGDLLAPIQRFRKVDVVVANLPYIPAHAIPEAPNPVGFEPRVALDGGPDGLDLYRRLLAQVPSVVAPGASLFLEAAPGTIDPLAALVEAAFPNAYIEVGEDYANCDRFVQVILDPSG
jgi:release factor glutamine methyltransferase